jgi:ABC-type Mn2+/Zn2+ transport system ATPase subunit
VSDLKKKKKPPRVREDARLATVTVTDGALGGGVTLDLEAKRTVLVGHNGAGKSLFLESLHEAANLAVRRTFRGALDVTAFSCEIAHGSQRIRYSFQRVARNTPLEDDTGTQLGTIWDWTETCVDLTAEQTLWKVDKGIATIGGDEIKLEQGVGLLAIPSSPSVHLPRGLSIVRDILARVRRVSAGVPRSSDLRVAMYLMRAPNSRGLWQAPMRGPDYRVEYVARSILNWYESDRERYEEYLALGKRLNLWSSLEPAILAKAIAAPTPDETPRDVGLVAVDKVNFGFLSDGTLRAAEILALLVNPIGRVLLIEEPETSIHPGLLRRLLNEVDSYSLQKQVVISTHSTDVVSQSQPQELRLVHRGKNATSIQPLNQNQHLRLKGYLCDEGTLGEFLFGGGADD